LEFEKTSIEGVWIGMTKVHQDIRGDFREWFKSSDLPVGLNFIPRQANTSVSKKGVIRGIHYSNAPKGQNKLVTCVSGSVRDFYVDLRRESKTFLKWGFQDLHSNLGTSIFVGSGIGHAFQSLQDGTVLTYLLDSEFNPEMEYSLYPFDEKVGIVWPVPEPIISNKDRLAPRITELIKNGLLPK
jgi:dTDP-4-dehydrorhamnose 3,5-epimerase